jgi:NAD(P)-dependent dehydrogenase (short-subunit alcohol dehydrogenase family)
VGVLDTFDLSGKVAVVTGGNRGLGEAWVRSLLDVGATVVIAARDDDRSREVAERIGDRVDNASKAAVHQLTKSLAAEWAPLGVRVNALAPGYTKTDMAPVDQPEFRARWIEDVPMQRYALPDEYGPALVFLASDASSFMTGATLVMDGGYTLY